MPRADLSKVARSCYSKIRYPNAAAAARIVIKIAKELGKKQRTYYCMECCGYHTTKQE